MFALKAAYDFYNSGRRIGGLFCSQNLESVMFNGVEGLYHNYMILPLGKCLTEKRRGEQMTTEHLYEFFIGSWYSC